MKKLILTGITAALIAGVSTLSHAAPISSMDVDISGLGQFNYNWSQADLSNDQLDVSRLRLNIAAKPAEHVSFYSALEATKNTDGDSRLVDGYVDLTYIPQVTARIGQFALPNSYELNTPEYNLETINYSQGVGVFSMRDRGIALVGKPIPEIKWSAFVMNGAGAVYGANTAADDQSLFGLQLDGQVLPNFSLKGWGAWQKETIAASKLNAYGIGFDYKYEGLHLSGEYNTADTEMATVETDRDEILVTLGYTIPETTLQLVARYDALETEVAAGSTDSDIITAGFNWDFEKNARLQVMYEIKDTSANPDPDDNQLDVQLSVKF